MVKVVLIGGSRVDPTLFTSKKAFVYPSYMKDI